MKSIAKKLKSKSGASIMMALVMLLVAITVSAVIISASVTAMQGAKGDLANRQAMLKAASAAELMKNELDGAVFEYSRTTVYNDLNHTSLNTRRDPVTKVTDCAFPELIADAAQKAYGGLTYETTLVFGEENMGDVSASFKMTKSQTNDYRITVTFSTDGGGKNDSLMTVTASGTAQPINTSIGYEATAGYSIKWSNVEIRKGAAE